MVKNAKKFGKGKPPTTLINSEGTLTKSFESVIEDIFRKFDMIMSRELSYEEFRLFF